MLSKSYEYSLRLFIAPFIFIYGAVKPWQFEDAFSNTFKATNELEGMAIMWAFFGYSYTVPIIVGVFECSGSILLVFNRTKLFGGLLLLPIFLNIVLFNIVYEVSAIPTVNAIFYLSAILFVFYSKEQKLLRLQNYYLSMVDRPRKPVDSQFIGF